MLSRNAESFHCVLGALTKSVEIAVGEKSKEAEKCTLYFYRSFKSQLGLGATLSGFDVEYCSNLCRTVSHIF